MVSSSPEMNMFRFSLKVLFILGTLVFPCNKEVKASSGCSVAGRWSSGGLVILWWASGDRVVWWWPFGDRVVLWWPFLHPCSHLLPRCKFLCLQIHWSCRQRGWKHRFVTPKYFTFLQWNICSLFVVKALPKCFWMFLLKILWAEHRVAVEREVADEDETSSSQVEQVIA